jgi:hypothetical protein
VFIRVLAFAAPGPPAVKLFSCDAPAMTAGVFVSGVQAEAKTSQACHVEFGVDVAAMYPFLSGCCCDGSAVVNGLEKGAPGAPLDVRPATNADQREPATSHALWGCPPKKAC